MSRSMIAGVVLVVLGGCQKSCERPPEPAGGGVRMGVQKSRVKIGGLGEQRLKGLGTDMRATVDGKIVTALLEAEKPRLEGVPPLMRVGELWAAPTTGGAPKKLGTGVTNMPGGQFLSADSRWSFFLAGYNAAQQAGELMGQDLGDLAKAPAHLGSQVSYYVPSDDSKLLAFVEEGVLKVGPLPEGPFRAVSGEVAAAEFDPSGKTLYLRRRVAAGGGLFQVAVDDEKRPPKKITDLVGDFELTRDGTRLTWLARETVRTPRYELYTSLTGALAPKRVADGVLRFFLSPDGKWLAWLQGDSPQQPGELWLASADGSGGRKLAENVKDLVFTPDSLRLAFRQNFREVQFVGEQLERVGELMLVSLPEGAPKSVHKHVANFVFSADGKHLAFGASVFKPAFSRDLYLLREGAAEPVKLKEWIFEYAFSPANDRLFYRADCTREGRACILYSVATGPGEVKPSQEADSVFNFRLSADGGRVLFTYAHTQGDLFDVSVLNVKTKAQKTIEQDIKLPAVFLEKDGSRVAYLVGDKSRAGIHVAANVP